jgi:hypothetical protein
MLYLNRFQGFSLSGLSSERPHSHSMSSAVNSGSSFRSKPCHTVAGQLGCRSLPVIFPSESISVAITFTACLVTSRVFWACRISGLPLTAWTGVASCSLAARRASKPRLPPPRHRDGARPGNDARSWTQPSSLCGSGLRPGGGSQAALTVPGPGPGCFKNQIVFRDH